MKGNLYDSKVTSLIRLHLESEIIMRCAERPYSNGPEIIKLLLSNLEEIGRSTQIASMSSLAGKLGEETKIFLGKMSKPNADDLGDDSTKFRSEFLQTKIPNIILELMKETKRRLARIPASSGKAEAFLDAHSDVDMLLQGIDIPPEMTDYEAEVYRLSRGKRLEDRLKLIYQSFCYMDAEHRMISQEGSEVLGTRVFWEEPPSERIDYAMTWIRLVKMAEFSGFSDIVSDIRREVRSFLTTAPTGLGLQTFAVDLWHIVRAAHFLTDLKDAMAACLDNIIDLREPGEGSWRDGLTTAAFAFSLFVCGSTDKHLAVVKEAAVWLIEQNRLGCWSSHDGLDPDVLTTCLASSVIHFSRLDSRKYAMEDTYRRLLEKQSWIGKWFDDEIGLSDCIMTVVVLDTLDLISGKNRLSYPVRQPSAAETYIALEPQRSTGFESVDYFVLTALPEECKPLLKHLNRTIDCQDGFSLATIETDNGPSRSVLILPSGCGQGTVAATHATDKAIHRYRPRIVLLLGIAGGFDENRIHLGDVLVPEYVDAYELAKVKAGKGGKPKIEYRQPPYSVSAQKVINQARSISRAPQTWHSRIEVPRPNNTEAELPVIHATDRGVLGSGDKNLADRNAQERRHLINVHQSRALGFDMEAAGVAYACLKESVLYAIVKGVQDNGTLDKDSPQTKDQWRGYAADAAAALVALIISECSLERETGSTYTNFKEFSYQTKQLSDQEIMQHYSKEKLIEYNHKKLPQVSVDQVPFGLTEDEMRFIEGPPDFELPVDLRPIKERIVKQVQSMRTNANYYESLIWRISGFEAKSHTLTFTKTRYSEYVATNLAAELGFVVRGKPLLYLLEEGKMIKPLKDAKAANNLGVGAMLITSDDYTVLQRRSHQTLDYPGMLGPSASGLMRIPAERDPKPNPFNSMLTQIQDELQIEPKEIVDLRYVGLTRELRRAGKPEMFFLARTSLSLSEVLERFAQKPRDARETEDLQEIALNDTRGTLPEENLSIAAKTGILLLSIYWKDQPE